MSRLLDNTSLHHPPLPLLSSFSHPRELEAPQQTRAQTAASEDLSTWTAPTGQTRWSHKLAALLCVEFAGWAPCCRASSVQDKVGQEKGPVAKDSRSSAQELQNVKRKGSPTLHSHILMVFSMSVSTISLNENAGVDWPRVAAANSAIIMKLQVAVVALATSKGQDVCPTPPA